MAHIVVGRFGRPHGVRGWIKVNSNTTPSTDILNYSPWFTARNGNLQELSVTASRILGDKIIVKLPGYDSPEAVQSLTNCEIAVLSEQLPALPEGEYYWSDLIGLKVINQKGIDLGTVQELLATGANDVLVVSGERKRLIPYITSVILQVDLGKQLITVEWDEDF